MVVERLPPKPGIPETGFPGSPVRRAAHGRSPVVEPSIPDLPTGGTIGKRATLQANLSCCFLDLTIAYRDSRFHPGPSTV
jgi:hypothetical protein